MAPGAAGPRAVRAAPPPAFLLICAALKPVRGWAEAAYVAWFGPIGVAALFYALHAAETTGDEGWFHVTSFVIFTSAALHGLTAEPVARRFPRPEPRRSERLTLWRFRATLRRR